MYESTITPRVPGIDISIHLLSGLTFDGHASLKT